MSLYANNVTIGGLFPLTALTAEAVLPVFYNNATYKVTVGNFIAQINKASLGLNNVDNTADANKPVSGPVATALAAKADTLHQHSTAQVTGLDAALSQRALLNHTHNIGDVSGLQAALADTANKVHVHAIADVDGLTASLAAKANTSTIVSQLAGKTDVGHTHQASDIIGLPAVSADLATRTFVQDAIAAEPVHAHTHQLGDIAGLTAAINGKANTATVDQQISTLTASIASKADTLTVTNALATKADASAVAAKADTVTVNAALATKLGSDALDGFTSQLTALQDYDVQVQSALLRIEDRVNGRALAQHTHEIVEIFNLPQTLQLMQSNIQGILDGTAGAPGGATITGVLGFDANTTSLILSMSDSTTVPLDMSKFIIYLITNVLPTEIQTGIDNADSAGNAIYQVPVDTPTLTPDFRNNRNINWVLSTNGVLDNPLDFIRGRSGSIFITQGTGGSKTLAFSGAYRAAGGIGNLPALSTAQGAVDRIDYIVYALNNVQISITKDIKA
jgi:hypothetical protein